MVNATPRPLYPRERRSIPTELSRPTILTIVPFIFHDASTVLTIDHSCIKAGGVELGACEFTLMVVCGRVKCVGKNIVNICIE